MMLRPRWPGSSLLALCALLVFGCRSHPVASRPAALPPPPPASAGNEPDEPDDSDLQKAAAAHARYATGVIHELNEEPDAAFDDYYEAALEDPANEGLILELSDQAPLKKQPEKALELLRRSAARPDASAAIYARLGLVYAQLGKFDEAVAADRTAIQRNPAGLAGYQNLFLTYLQDKKETEALRILDEAAQQKRVDASFLLGLADSYGRLSVQSPSLKKKANAGALAALRRADQLNPASASQRFQLADGFASVGDIARATQIYLDMLKKLPDVPLLRQRIHAKLAAIYLQDSDAGHAAEQLESILRDDPANAQVCYFLGRVLYEEKKPARAVEYLKKAVLLSPDLQEAYFYLAVVQLELNQASDALATLEKAREKYPGNFDLELWTGLACMQQKTYRQALHHFTQAEILARATDPSRLNYEFYFQFGAASERSGDLEQAADYFQKCLKLKPDWPEALNYLGYMWAEHDQHLPQALEMLEKAVKAEPKNGAYLDSLGWVCFKMRQPDRALKYILQAVALGKEPDPTEYDHLGDVYQALKQPDKARQAWTKSLSLEANDTVRQKLDALGSPAQ